VIQAEAGGEPAGLPGDAGRRHGRDDGRDSAERADLAFGGGQP